MTKRPLALDQPLSIAAVERDTGIGKDTLRVWERRYGFPIPHRDATGERVYPKDQVDRLRLVKRLLDRGLRPGRIVGATADELAAIAEKHHPVRQPIPPAVEPLLSLVREARAPALRAAFVQALMRHGLQRFVLDVVAPLNGAVGEAWINGEIKVHEEHLYTEQVQNVLRGAIHGQAGQGDRPHVLLTTFPEEEHGLGLLMAEAMLVTEGCRCVSLGVQTPLEEIVSGAADCGADAVGLSFSAAYPARQLVEGLTSLRASLPADTEIWLGGAGVVSKARQLPGASAFRGFEDLIAYVREWREKPRAPCTESQRFGFR